MKREKTRDVAIEKGQKIPLTIKRLGINGEGVGYYKRKVIFVPGALPGEEVVVEVTNVHPGYAEGAIHTVRKPSPERVKPPCPVYDQCGGCQLQHLRYDAQLREKKDIVRQAFERYTNLTGSSLPLRDTMGMDDPWHYRNKSQLQVQKKKEQVLAGLYAMNSHRLIDLSDCLIQHPATNRVTQEMKAILQDLNIPIYDERRKTGLVRTIVTRVGVQTGEVQLVIITTEKHLPKKELLIEEIRRRLPEVKSLMQNINGRKTSLIFGEETLHLAGEEVIQESLGDLSFELSARAFFQLNPTQTVRVYDEVKKAAQLTGKEKVVDAYCGVGTIGLWLARHASEVRGMDVTPEAIADANANAKKHGFPHVQYVVGKAETWLPRWVKEGWHPDVIVVDPPRTGCDKRLLETIIAVKPKRLVYVSCNPSTLAKDSNKLLQSGFRLQYVQPVDMFPHTSHVECVSQIVGKG
ncbi:tRNA (uracil-5-)-methyltransferase/23S rRNA (uracil1939-C5)-methyltransferase [Caldalkalibacillus uzonensis]|uniref:tRNA (Uracil-5-)-methyltransferase/23S rRNA (Uracil1939-C5)-methyltransferase n=1 Tax=Caldalkalibacillus uzonensis TaxID=353224 RepID=A0ABU0CUS4_9BACI|nr:23S rRNA (uracil(1939)-C(5))-methyltransferase RlmD [Caldalkalibacillus uzonensis]MDQ0340079.1 tRNA (uracil-5-)-methyltransferase/23S rRNA (uracil1939-C5)-methyltransferase [Caldalkalibacillus uzonensis]